MPDVSSVAEKIDAADQQADLARQIVDVDRHSLTVWFRRFMDSVYSFVCYRLGRDPELAADALQATFLAALARVNDTIRGRGCSTSPRGVAILSASQFTEPERRTELVEAFNSWYDEVTEAGHEMAIPQQLVEQLKQYDQTYVHIGQWYLGRHNPEKAQQYYSIAYMGHRQSVLRSQVLANMGRHDEAREVYREVTDVKWAAGLRGYVDQAKATLN